MDILSFFRQVNSKISSGLVLKKGAYIEKGLTIKDDLIVKTGDVVFNDIQEMPPIPPPPIIAPPEMIILPPGTVVSVPLPNPLGGEPYAAVLLIKLPLDDGSTYEPPI